MDITTFSFGDVALVDMPTLCSVSSSSNSSESSNNKSVYDGVGSGAEGDNEDSESEEMDIDSASDSDTGGFGAKLCNWIHSEIEDMYSKRYQQPQNQLPRGPSYLTHVLMTLKNGCTDHFRTCLCVTL